MARKIELTDQEALDLRPQDIHFKSPAHVRLMGKGRKERISPIWPETADLVTALIRRQPRKPDEPIFVNRYRSPLTASGFRFRLRQYVEAAARAPVGSSGVLEIARAERSAPGDLSQDLRA